MHLLFSPVSLISWDLNTADLLNVLNRKCAVSFIVAFKGTPHIIFRKRFIRIDVVQKRDQLESIFFKLLIVYTTLSPIYRKAHHIKIPMMKGCSRMNLPDPPIIKVPFDRPTLSGKLLYNPVFIPLRICLFGFGKRHFGLFEDLFFVHTALFRYILAKLVKVGRVCVELKSSHPHSLDLCLSPNRTESLIYSLELFFLILARVIVPDPLRQRILECLELYLNVRI